MNNVTVRKTIARLSSACFRRSPPIDAAPARPMPLNAQAITERSREASIAAFTAFRTASLALCGALATMLCASSFAQDAKPTSTSPAPNSAGAETTMKAVRIHEYGGVDVLKYEDAPRPAPSTGELLVRVYAAGVNPVDDKVRSGAFSAFTNFKMPMILGWDVSGVVEQVGKDVTKFKAGDPIFAYMDVKQPGAYAEYAIVRETDACPKPTKLTYVEAAGVPLAATTAWQALVDTAKIEPGQTVLIHGGAGGVGHFAIQIAKARGAKVIATGSAKSLAFMRQLGASISIDYTAAKFEDFAQGVDVVLDTVGGDTQTRSFNVLKKGGILVSIVQPPSQELAKEKEVRAVIFLAHPDGAELAEISKLIQTDKLKPTVSKTFPLSDAAKAHEQIETKHTKGKVVLEVTRAQAPPAPK